MAGYLSSLPALQTQVPDISQGVNYLASIPDELRKDRMENEKMSLLRQATEMKQDEFTVDMGTKVGEWAFKAGSLADTPEKWDRFRSTLSPYTQKYGLPDPGEFNGRDAFLAEGAQLFGKGSDLSLSEIYTESGQPQKVVFDKNTGKMTPVGGAKLAGEGKAESPAGKVESDFRAGLLTKEQRDAAMNKLTLGKGLVPVAEAKKKLAIASDSIGELVSNAEAIINHPGTQYTVGTKSWAHSRGTMALGAFAGSQAQDA